MIVTVKLRGLTVDDAAMNCRQALEEFAGLPPSYLALDRWLRTSYRRALVGGMAHAARSLLPPTPTDVAVTSAQCRLANMRRLAQAHDLVRDLPARVYIARVEDDAGKLGFAPVDAKGEVPLVSRVLSLFFADYLMRPEHYMGAKRSSLGDDG